MFVGTSFLKMPEAFGEPPSILNDINYISLSDGVADEMFITKKILATWDGSIPDTWDFDTVMKALFRNSLLAGNIDYALETIQAARIKVRPKDTFEWRTIYEKEINTEADLAFDIYDPLNASNLSLEYAFVPVINGSEGEMFINDVVSKFEGIFLVEKDRAYQALLNIQNQYSLNYETSIVKPMGRKYPVVKKNGLTKFYSGTLNATFIKEDKENRGFDLEHGYLYRQEIEEFLTNGKPKILKDFEGKIWMIQIVDNITIDSSGHYQNPVHSINWTEIGDETSIADLYDNGFIDTDVDRK